MPLHVNIFFFFFAGTFGRSAEQMAARATLIISEWLRVILATFTKSQAAVTPLSWLSDAFSKTLVSLVREHRDTVWQKEVCFFSFNTIRWFQKANVHRLSLSNKLC